MEVGIREFTRNVYRYMKDGGRYVVTSNGKAVYDVTIMPVGVVTVDEPVEHEYVSKAPIGIDEKGKPMMKKVYDRYGCGCRKEEKDRLCKKHGRV